MKRTIAVLIVLTMAIVGVAALVARIIDHGTLVVGEYHFNLREYRSVRESGPMPAGVRALDIPFEENGYGDLKSQVIRSHKELDRFLQMISQQNSWNGCGKFIGAIKDAEVDFDKEALILLRNKGGSGSVEVRFRVPRVSGDTMTCDVTTRRPIACTRDIVFYGAAFAVDRERIKLVRLVVDGEVTFTSPLSDE